MLEAGPFLLTLKLALITTAILYIIGIPVAYWLSTSAFRGKIVVEAVLSLPLILPPSVMGFYLLIALSPANSFGRWIDEILNLRLVFTFHGLILASVVYSLPFMIQPLLAGFRMLPGSLAEASYTLGKGKWTTLRRVLLPNIRAAVITGGILTFAHTLGEFGVVLMVGGNIPGETRVISVAIYDAVEAMDYGRANLYSGILLVFAFVLLLGVYLVNYRSLKAT